MKKENRLRNMTWIMAGILVMGMLAGCAQKTKNADVSNEVSKDLTEMTEEVSEEVVETAEEVMTKEAEEAPEKEAGVKAICPLEDGIYEAAFDTDSSMFHVNEANEGKGILTVKDGIMTMHISLPSKSIVNLFPGLAEDAMKDGAVLLEPTMDTVTYKDGMTEEVHGFDIPVPVIDEEFDLALIGTKGKWYDHKVVVSNPVLANSDTETQEAVILEDGEYEVELILEGGTGKASIESPAKMVVKDGIAMVTITWSSPNYDYMLLDGEKYLPVNTEGNSVFELPFKEFGKPVTVIGDTTAMSKPHEVEYTIVCNIK